MKRILVIAIALTLGTAFCEGEGKPTQPDKQKMVKIGNKMVPIEKVRESVHKASLSKNGGRIRKPDSARGYFVLLNATEIGDDKVSPAMGVIDKRAKVHTKLVKLGAYEPGKAKECVASAGGVLGVILFSDENASSLVVAPEDGWAAVNAAPLKKDAANDEVFESRVRKEILRAFAFVSGGAYTSKGDFLMRDVRRASDLDRMKLEDYGVDMLQRFEEGLPFYGLKPWHETTYRKACEEGWAPAPTNEFQKAIWDEIHTSPKNPMKIEFDPKKGR